MSKLNRKPDGKRALQLLFFACLIAFLLLGIQLNTVIIEEGQRENDTVVIHGLYGTRADDCASCHYTITQDVAAGKHSWAACDTCHDPNSKSEINITTECSYCHGNKHDFEYPSCMDCHDQHATGFRHDVGNEQCSTCHGNASAHLDMGPHSWQACTNCHQNHTAPANQCDSCHGIKHTDLTPGGYEYPECEICHVPMSATFRHNLSNEVCEDCHASEFLKLQTGGHSEEQCNECHDEHQAVTKTCDECHGEYHGYTYPKCLECHEPMHAASATPEEDLATSVLFFAIIVILGSVLLSIGLAVISRGRGEEEYD